MAEIKSRWPWEEGFIGPQEEEVLSPDEEEIANLEAQVARLDALIPQVEALEDALKFALATINSEGKPNLHRTVGELCGEDVCWLCAAETTLREALATSSRRDEGGEI